MTKHEFGIRHNPHDKGYDIAADGTVVVKEITKLQAERIVEKVEKRMKEDGK